MNKRPDYYSIATRNGAPMQLKDALANGYKLAGYVSRKAVPESQIVYIAEGRRKGELFVNLPAYNTSRYYIRQYLTR